MHIPTVLMYMLRVISAGRYKLRELYQRDDSATQNFVMIHMGYLYIGYERKTNGKKGQELVIIFNCC